MSIFLQTLDEAWPGSEKLAAYAGQLASAPQPVYDWVMTVVMLALLVYCIIFFNRLALALSISIKTFFSGSEKLQDICENQTLLSSVNVAALICLPVLVLLLYVRGWTAMSPVGMCIALLAFLLMRAALFEFVSWYKGEKGIFDTIRNAGRVTVVVATLLSLPAFIAPVLFGAAAGGFARIWFTCAFALCFVLYCLKACKYLLEADFSIFFCFLYLCTLEFLPAGLLIGAIITL